MTGGFQTSVRGIEIDVTKTLNKFSKQNKSNYTKRDFEDYLKKIGLLDALNLGKDEDENISQIETDKKFYTGLNKQTPVENGFIVVFDFDEGDDQEAIAYVSNGIWEYQNWVLQKLDKKSLDEFSKFYDPGWLNKKYSDKLITNWQDKIVIKKDSDYAMYMIGCEWTTRYFNKNQNGGNSNTQKYATFY